MARSVWPLVAGLALFNILVIIVMAFSVPYDGPTVTLAPALRLERRATGGIGGHYSLLPPFSNPAVEPRGDADRRPMPPTEPRGDAGQRPRPQIRDYFLYPFGVHQKGWTGVGLYVTSLVVMLGLCAAVLHLPPQRLLLMRDVVGIGWGHALRSAVTGLLGYALVAGMVVLLTVLIVGIPLAVLTVLACILLSVFGLVTASLVIGRGLTRAFVGGRSSPLVDLTAGILLLFPLSIVPLAGWLIIAIATSLGFGAILLTKFGGEEGWTLQA